RGDVRDTVCAGEGFMVAAGKPRTRRGWPEDLLILVEGLLHDRFKGADRRHAPVETFRSTDRLEADKTAFEPAKADAFAAEGSGERVAEGQCRRAKARL